MAPIKITDETKLSIAPRKSKKKSKSSTPHGCQQKSEPEEKE